MIAVRRGIFLATEAQTVGVKLTTVAGSKTPPTRFSNESGGFYGLDHPPLLARFVSLSRHELARHVTYLRAVNEILRSKLPERVTLSNQERRKLRRRKTDLWLLTAIHRVQHSNARDIFRHGVRDHLVISSEAGQERR
jgi:hypothetical protein